MAALKNQTAEVAERSTARMNFRTKPHIKETIQRAAALSGVDDSVFTLNAAYQAAIETIATHERLALSRADAEVFFAALDNPGPPTPALRKIAKRYHERYSGQ
jgi:uncharacterized protein (DUF1778 family)